MTEPDSRLTAKIQSLKALPILPEVTFGIIELGKKPDAGIEDYARLAEMDASLSSKLLALTNSSWFGCHHKVTTVRHAVSLLGATNVRALATSNCLAGVHNAWSTSPEDGRAYWESSLCKGVAARLIAGVIVPKRSLEAFACGLFQDIAIGLLACLDDNNLKPRLGDPAFTVSDQLELERSRFGIDHAQCGRLIAEKLAMPSPYLEATGVHHNEQELSSVLGDDQLAKVLYLASLLPHDIRSWKPHDIRELGSVAWKDQRIVERWLTTRDFIAQVEMELSNLMGLFTEGVSRPLSLTDLIREASAENVWLTEHIVAQTATLNDELSRLSEEKHAAELRSKHDPLTGFLNRHGFLTLAERILAQVTRRNASFGVAMLDLDRLKEANDTYGHDCGDFLLGAVADRIREATRQNDPVCRWGGDEIVVLLPNTAQADCVAAVNRICGTIGREPVQWRNTSLRLSVSAGVRWVQNANRNVDLSQLINEADQALYEAKRTRRGSVVCRSDAPATPGAPAGVKQK